MLSKKVLVRKDFLFKKALVKKMFWCERFRSKTSLKTETRPRLLSFTAFHVLSLPQIGERASII